MYFMMPLFSNKNIILPSFFIWRYILTTFSWIWQFDTEILTEISPENTC